MKKPVFIRALFILIFTINISTFITGCSSSDSTSSDPNYIPNKMDITSKFTDSKFKSEIYQLIGKNSDKPIFYSDVKGILILHLSGCEISNLSGIEYFTKLEDLFCDHNKLSLLDLSKNKKLTIIDCRENKLTTLDVSKNKKIDSLDCSYNKLTLLDVSNNTELKFLFCDVNKLSALDVSNNKKIINLQCGKIEVSY